MIYLKTRLLLITAIYGCFLLFSPLVTLATVSAPSQPNPEVITTVEKNSHQLVPQLIKQINKGQKIIYDTLTSYVQQNPEVYGAAFVLAPTSAPTDESMLKPAPYVYRNGEEIKKINLSESYDYTTQDWFSIPAQLKTPTWSKPYFDQGGGNEWMITYSIPVYADKEKNHFIGIITNDVLVPAAN